MEGMGVVKSAIQFTVVLGVCLQANAGKCLIFEFSIAVCLIDIYRWPRIEKKY